MVTSLLSCRQEKSQLVEEEEEEPAVHLRQEKSLVGQVLPASSSDQKHLELSVTPLFFSHGTPRCLYLQNVHRTPGSERLCPLPLPR